MREVTERPEGVWAGTVKLVGTDRDKIFQGIKGLLDNPQSYQAMAQARNPYGDGRAAGRIVQVLASLGGEDSSGESLSFEPGQFPSFPS